MSRTILVAAFGAGTAVVLLGGERLPLASRTLEAANEANVSLALLEHSGEVFGDVASTVSPAVVYIEAKQRDKQGEVYTEESGSGVLVKPSASDRVVVVTNLHVVVNARPTDIEVTLADGRLLVPEQVWSDRDTDLAVLDLATKDIPSARWGSSDEIRVGQWVLAIGSPFGLIQSVTHGIVSATQRRQLGLPQSTRIKEFIQTDAAINPGSSGGPLVNLRGEVVGINTAIASHTGASSGVGFAIPSQLAERVVANLVEHGSVKRAFLGVEFPVKFDHVKARGLGLRVARGALVAGITPGTPAARSGLAVGDVILEFNGQLVEDDNHLINMVSQSAVDATVKLTIWRQRKRYAVDVTLGDWNQFQAHAAQTTSPERE